MLANDYELGEKLRLLRGYRTLILGIGNRLKGDDGVGPFICDLIQDRVPSPVIDAGTAPENYLGPISRLEPEAILVLDAADLRAAPGCTAMLELEALTCSVCSTHTTSLRFMLGTIARSQQIRTRLLGIQPASVCLGEALSPPVRSRAALIATVLVGVFGAKNTTQLPGS